MTSNFWRFWIDHNLEFPWRIPVWMTNHTWASSSLLLYSVVGRGEKKCKGKNNVATSAIWAHTLQKKTWGTSYFVNLGKVCHPGYDAFPIPVGPLDLHRSCLISPHPNKTPTKFWFSASDFLWTIFRENRWLSLLLTSYKWLLLLKWNL